MEIAMYRPYVPPYFYAVVSPVLTGDGLTYTAFIPAATVAQAERFVREEPRFRKTMRQNGVDWRTAPVKVTRTSKNGKAH
jgi:hypothetical protein